MMSYVYVNSRGCDGCGACVPGCPTEAIQLEKGKARIDPDLCTGCMSCVYICPQECIRMASPAVSTPPSTPTVVPFNEPSADSEITYSRVLNETGEVRSVEQEDSGPAARVTHEGVRYLAGAFLSYLAGDVVPRVVTALIDRREARVSSADRERGGDGRGRGEGGARRGRDTGGGGRRRRGWGRRGWGRRRS